MLRYNSPGRLYNYRDDDQKVASFLSPSMKIRVNLNFNCSTNFNFTSTFFRTANFKKHWANGRLRTQGIDLNDRNLNLYGSGGFGTIGSRIRTKQTSKTDLEQNCFCDCT